MSTKQNNGVAGLGAVFARLGGTLRRYGAIALLPVLLLGGYYSATNHVVNKSPGETGLSALSLVRNGSIADPYLIPTGPTAHTAPGTVTIVAATYALFDGNTAEARIAQSFLATLLYVCAAFLVIRYCRSMFIGTAGMLAALVLTCVLPVHLFASIVYYRQWDQPVSAVLLTALLLIWIRSGRAGGEAWRDAVGLAVIGSIGGLFAPILPIIAIIAELDLWRRTRRWRAPLTGVVLIVASLMPWATRNEAMLGKFILTRSNFGLELAVGNHDASSGVFDLGVLPPIHPHTSQVAAQRLAAVGEVAYMAEMRDRAVGWITAQPSEFVMLCLTRARLLLFPVLVDRDPLFDRIKVAVIWTTSAVALVTLMWMLLQGWAALPWVACLCMPLAPYVLTHASERYAFPTFFGVTCLVATGVDAFARRSRQRQNVLPTGATA